jgi:exonuclease VII small subunit
MEKEKYEKKIAQLESLNDQLQAEFTNLDIILKELGFEKGILTLKEAAKEMLLNKNPSEQPEDSPIDDLEF